MWTVCLDSCPHQIEVATLSGNSLRTVTRQRRDFDLNPGPSAPESSTLTTRLPSHPTNQQPNGKCLSNADYVMDGKCRCEHCTHSIVYITERDGQSPTVAGERRLNNGASSRRRLLRGGPLPLSGGRLSSHGGHRSYCDVPRTAADVRRKAVLETTPEHRPARLINASANRPLLALKT